MCLVCTEENCTVCPDNLCEACQPSFYFYSNISCLSSCNTAESYFVKQIEYGEACIKCSEELCLVCQDDICSKCAAEPVQYHVNLTNNCVICQVNESQFIQIEGSSERCLKCPDDHCLLCPGGICDTCKQVPDQYHLHTSGACVLCQLSGGQYLEWVEGGREICRDCSENDCLVCPNDTCSLCTGQIYLYPNRSCLPDCATLDKWYVKESGSNLTCYACSDSLCAVCPNNVCQECLLLPTKYYFNESETCVDCRDLLRYFVGAKTGREMCLACNEFACEICPNDICVRC